jgi:hypothetical protein
VIHSSLCSTAKAVTSLRHNSLFGKILTTLVRRFISWLSFSRPFVVRMRLWWLSGRARGETELGEIYRKFKT